MLVVLYKTLHTLKRIGGNTKYLFKCNTLLLEMAVDISIAGGNVREDDRGAKKGDLDDDGRVFRGADCTNPSKSKATHKTIIDRRKQDERSTIAGRKVIAVVDFQVNCRQALVLARSQIVVSPYRTSS